jgi:hypothetical protein
MHVEHVHDVDVLDRARALGLPQEARRHLRVAREIRVQTLHCETALLEPEMTCLVDTAHPAFADDANDLVGLANELADERIVDEDALLGREGRRVARANEEVGGIELVAARAATRERRLDPGHRVRARERVRRRRDDRRRCQDGRHPDGRSHLRRSRLRRDRRAGRHLLRWPRLGAARKRHADGARDLRRGGRRHRIEGHRHRSRQAGRRPGARGRRGGELRDLWAGRRSGP